ncbi:acid-sensing ion channel 3-like [Ptychodera flava]|uniref:acid-sensing ion channel 3-like n=1 Tax=Ptychodera flava TaxID=63121 RepID=UPI00396A4E64
MMSDIKHKLNHNKVVTILVQPFQDDDPLPPKMDKGSTGNKKPIAHKKSLFFQEMYGFCKEISIGGMKYLANPSYGILRRLFWSLIVILAACVLCLQIYMSVATYGAYPSNTNQQIEYVNVLTFPAVTICNFNPFRKSIVDEMSPFVTQLIENMFPVYGVDYPAPNFTGLDFTDYSMTAFRLHTSHKLTDTIFRCTWKGQPCSTDNFTMILTDLGVCYTFNSGSSGSQSQTVQAPGSRFALQLLLDVQQWDYILGPTEVAGFKVILHDQGDTPRARDCGFAIAPGFTSVVSIKQSRIRNLPPPYGKCREKNLKYYATYSQSNCLLECESVYHVEKCGCRDYYMPGNASECNPYQFYNCSSHAIREFASGGISACDCPVPCSRTVYSQSLSIAKVATAVAQRAADAENCSLEYVNDNYALLELYYEDLSYQDIQQQKGYEFYQLWCDIGGSMGLLLGASLVTLVEVLDFCCLAILRKCFG